MIHRRIAMVLWGVDALIVAALAMFVANYMLGDSARSTPLYVPESTSELPAIAANDEWKDRELTESNRELPAPETYKPLYTIDVNREPPPRDGFQGIPTRFGVPKATITNARALGYPEATKVKWQNAATGETGEVPARKVGRDRANFSVGFTLKEGDNEVTFTAVYGKDEETPGYHTFDTTVTIAFEKKPEISAEQALEQLKKEMSIAWLSVFPGDAVAEVRIPADSQTMARVNVGSDCTAAGCRAKVLEINPKGLLVEYQVEAQKFELFLAMFSDEPPLPEGGFGRPEDPFGRQRGEGDTGPPRPAVTRPAGTPSTPSAPGAGAASRPSVKPVGTKLERGSQEPYDVWWDQASDTWTITVLEAREQGQAFDAAITQLNPRSVLDPDTGKYLGVQIQRVPPGSHVARRGFKSGDMIVSINGQPVKSLQDAKRYVKQNNDLDTYVVVYIRGGKQRTKTYRVKRD